MPFGASQSGGIPIEQPCQILAHMRQNLVVRQSWTYCGKFGLALIFSESGRCRQLGESVLLDDVYVPGGNSAAAVYVITEVGACDRLKGLSFAEVGVAAGHNSTGVDVTNENTHSRGDGAAHSC